MFFLPFTAEPANNEPADTVAHVSTPAGCRLVSGTDSWTLTCPATDLADALRRACWAVGATAGFLPALLEGQQLPATPDLLALGLAEVHLARRAHHGDLRLDADLAQLETALRQARRTGHPLTCRAEVSRDGAAG